MIQDQGENKTESYLGNLGERCIIMVFLGL